MNKDQRQARRENEILTAAHDLFIEKGLPNVTIDMIATRCSVGKGTVYNYFKSKDEIYAKLYLLHYQTLMKSIIEIEKVGMIHSKNLLSFLKNGNASKNIANGSKKN